MHQNKIKVLIPLGVLVVLLILGSVFYYLHMVGDNHGYAPEQPIPFSHKKHAGINKIQCLYCHANADNGRQSTVPAMNVCMNCHSVVKTDSPFIQKLTDYYKRGEPIPWVKVHDVADHVYFNHKRHVTKGIACETCHGDIKEEDRVVQSKTLMMGFCVSCHKANNAPLQCSTCHQ